MIILLPRLTRYAVCPFVQFTPNTLTGSQRRDVSVVSPIHRTKTYTSSLSSVMVLLSSRVHRTAGGYWRDLPSAPRVLGGGARANPPWLTLSLSRDLVQPSVSLHSRWTSKGRAGATRAYIDNRLSGARDDW